MPYYFDESKQLVKPQACNSSITNEILSTQEVPRKNLRRPFHASGDVTYIDLSFKMTDFSRVLGILRAYYKQDEDCEDNLDNRIRNATRHLSDIGVLLAIMLS
jgi:hypothetical protein